MTDCHMQLTALTHDITGGLQRYTVLMLGRERLEADSWAILAQMGFDDAAL